MNDCKSRIPNSFDCFTRCFVGHYENLYSTGRGYNYDVLKTVIGNEGLNITSRRDWKINLGDKFVDECSHKIRPHTCKTPFCNGDVRIVSGCYWQKMFDRCPRHLKDMNKCRRLYPRINHKI